jgi:hypothetical protein
LKAKKHFDALDLILVGDVLTLQNCKNKKRVSYQFRYPRGSDDDERRKKGEKWGYWASCDNHFDFSYLELHEDSHDLGYVS